MCFLLFSVTQELGCIHAAFSTSSLVNSLQLAINCIFFYNFIII